MPILKVDTLKDAIKSYALTFVTGAVVGFYGGYQYHKGPEQKVVQPSPLETRMQYYLDKYSNERK